MDMAKTPDHAHNMPRVKVFVNFLDTCLVKVWELQK